MCTGRPTGALMEKSLLDDNGVRETFPDKTVDSHVLIAA